MILLSYESEDESDRQANPNLFHQPLFSTYITDCSTIDTVTNEETD